MEKLTKEKLLELGFEIIFNENLNFDEPIYRMKGEKLKSNYSPNGYPFDIDVVIGDYPETNGNVGMVCIHEDEQKDVSAPTNEDINATIDLEELWQPIAYRVCTVERLKQIVESLTEVKI